MEPPKALLAWPRAKYDKLDEFEAQLVEGLIHPIMLQSAPSSLTPSIITKMHKFASFVVGALREGYDAHDFL
jgi:hypothetical protein